jgi:hypothetical protein
VPDLSEKKGKEEKRRQTKKAMRAELRIRRRGVRA